MPTLVALLVCLIPTTIGRLLAAIGIAGMERAPAANIIAKSGKAVELAGDVDTCVARQDRHDYGGQSPRDQFLPVGSHSSEKLAGWPLWPRPPIETPEGKEHRQALRG